MAHTYNRFGWYDGDGEGARSTPVAPSNFSTSETPGNLRSNWTGHAWVELPYVPRVFVPVEPVPESVTMLQAQLELIEAGHYDTVETYFATRGNAKADKIAKVMWAKAGTVERNHELTATLQAVLALTDEQTDDLFRNASKR